jgi:hypothetical protein
MTQILTVVARVPPLGMGMWQTSVSADRRECSRCWPTTLVLLRGREIGRFGGWDATVPAAGANVSTTGMDQEAG